MLFRSSFGHMATGALLVCVMLPENQFGIDTCPRSGSDVCWCFELRLGQSCEIAKLLEANNAFSYAATVDRD